MTEAEWMACADPARMLYAVQRPPPEYGGFPTRKISERQLRLWVEACRLYAPPGPPWSNNVKTFAEVEQAAHDWCLGASWTEECPLALRAALLRDLVGNPFADRTWLIHRCPQCLQEGRWHWRGSDYAPLGQWPYCPDCKVEMRHRRDLWLAPAVLSLARAAHEERLPDGFLDPARLAVLSDALEEAGCEEAAILEHLRSPGPHALGCFCVDLLIGKERICANATS